MSVHKKVLSFTGDHQLCAVSIGQMRKNWVKRLKPLINKLLAQIDCSHPAALLSLVFTAFHCNGTGLAAHSDVSTLFSIYVQSHTWKKHSLS